MNWTIIFTDYYYLIILALVMIATGYSTTYNLFGKTYNWLCKYIKNKKVLLVLLSAIGGVLPIKGRVVASAGIFDLLLKKDTHSKLRPKFGILNYIATHHYYMWSPLEKTVLIPMAVLNLSWLQMMGYTWPLLLICILALLSYITIGLRYLENTDLKIEEQKITKPEKIPMPWEFIDWKMLGMVWCILMLGVFAKEYSDTLITWMNSHHGNLFFVSLAAFVASFILGSSGKFAGIVAGLTVIYGLPYLTYFMAIEFAGYLLSPTHKCNIISMKYFDTPIKQYVTVMIIWASFIIAGGIVTIL